MLGALVSALPTVTHAAQPTTADSTTSTNPNNPAVQRPGSPAPTTSTTPNTQPAPIAPANETGASSTAPAGQPSATPPLDPAPVTPTVQRPTTGATPSTITSPPPTTDPAAPTSPAHDPGANPTTTTAATEPAPAVSLEPSYDRQTADAVTPPPMMPPSPASGDPDAAVRAHYAAAYRPPDNPGRLYLGARAAVLVAGGSEGLGGRGVVARTEVGHTWNVIGYALGVTLIGGAFQQVVDDEIEQFPVLIGGGPSLSLGRLSLLKRSFFDVRVAYDFLTGSVYRNGQAQARVSPHGPRIDIDLGLLALGAEARRRRHGFGATLGWQRLLGSLGEELAPSTLLTFGAVYKFS